MGYETTNRGKDEEIAHISRSMGEEIREEWNIYLSIKFRGRGGENVQLLRTFFSRNKKRNVSISMKHICSASKQNIYFGESNFGQKSEFTFRSISQAIYKPSIWTMRHDVLWWVPTLNSGCILAITLSKHVFYYEKVRRWNFTEKCEK